MNMPEHLKGTSGRKRSGSPVEAPAKCNSTISGKAPRLALGLQGQQNVTVLDLLELLVVDGGLGAVGLVCFGSCSKACRSAATAMLEQGAVFMLPASVKQAAAALEPPSNVARKSRDAVDILLFGAASRRARKSLCTPTAAAQYISISRMPREIATVLLAVGLRFSYEQFKQAVLARTLGVDVWVKALVEHPLLAAEEAAGLPEGVHVMCYRPFELVNQLKDARQPPEALQDMLLMAFNMLPVPVSAALGARQQPPYNAATSFTQAIIKQQAATAAWKQWMAQNFTPELAGSLFLAAAARENTEGMRLLDVLQPGAATAALIGAALADAVRHHKIKTLRYLCGLSSARTAGTGLFVPPLLIAVRRSYEAGVQEFLSIDTLLLGLGEADVANLLLAMLQARSSDKLFLQVMQLPAARQLQWGSFEVLLEAAVAQQNSQLFAFMHGMPAQAAQMGPGHVLAAAEVAAKIEDVGALHQCLAHPAAKAFDPSQLSQLLKTVVQKCSMFAFLRPLEAMLDMPAAQHLSSQMIQEVLGSAFSATGAEKPCRCLYVLRRLVPLMCQLPQAHSIQPSSILRWLQLAFARPSEPVTAALCSWLERNATQPSAAQALASFSSKAAADLLAAALPTRLGGFLSGFETVCSFDFVRRAADASTVVNGLGSALAFKGVGACMDPAAVAKLLLQLPAAADIPASALAQLMECVLQQCTDDLLTDELLQQLQEAGSLPGPGDVLSLVKTCSQDRTDECAAACIQLLCCDPAAQQVSGSTVQQLLLDAVELQRPYAMLALALGLPAATAQLSSKQVETVLHATVTASLKHHSEVSAIDSRPSTGLEAAEQANACSWAVAVEALDSMPALHQIDADAVLQLLVRAVKAGAVGAAQYLAGIESLQQLDLGRVCSLLRLAVRLKQPGCLQALLQLPGAASFYTTEQMLQMLQASVQKDEHQMAGVLCDMQSAQLLQPQQVSGLLSAAVKQGTSLASVAPLCKLPAASQLSMALVKGLIGEVHTTVLGLAGAAKKQRTAEFNSLVRCMQTSRMAASAASRAQEVPARKQVALTAVAALQELHSAGRIHGS